jgi:predicted transcriptional regulator
MDKRISKNYALQALRSYADVVDNIPVLIKQSGYRVEFIAEKLQIPRSTFYSKRRDKAFSFNEMLKIITLINDDEDEISEEEDMYLCEIAKQRMADPDTVSHEQVMSILRAR